MATFKAIVRRKRADGLYPVYIRICHKERMGYIKTDKIVSAKSVTKTGEIKDALVNEFCSREILRYTNLTNQKDLTTVPTKSNVQVYQKPHGGCCSGIIGTP